MNRKRQIKVIKKSDIAIAQTSPIEKKITEKDVRRRMESTISTWVKEFQQRPLNQF